MRKITKSLLTLALLVAGVGVANAQTPFAFDALGKATIAKGALVGAGGLSYNPATGELSSDGTEGTLTLEFTEPVDLRNLKHFNVTNSGQTNDILSRLEFYDEDNKKINTWNSIKLSNLWNPTGIDDNATNTFLNNKPVKKMVWPSDANASNNGKTATITSVEFICKTIACAKAGETVLKSLPWIEISSGTSKTPDWNMNGSSDTYYGNYSGDPTHYADLSSYSELRVYCKDNNTGFRCFFINAAGTAVNQIHTSAASWNAEKKYYSLDLSTIEKWESKVALKAIKAENGGGPGERNITNIVVYNTPAANAPQYTLTGSGLQLAETVAALADATATCIDATGVTGITTNSEAGRTLLTSANPNCLFLGTTGNGGLSNTKNVVDGSTCANLVLEDNHPFKAPADFTATAASYTTTITAAGAGTLCLPFAATIPGGVEAWTLAYTSGDAAVATPVSTTTISANTPVLLNGSGEKTFTGASAAVSASATNKAGALTGVFAAATVPVNSYVLQKQDAKVGFFKVTGDKTINPFRAYLTAETPAPSLRIIFPEDNDVTGISEIEKMKNADNVTIFDLQGRKVAQPQKGLYIVNGKKVIFK